MTYPRSKINPNSLFIRSFDWFSGTGTYLGTISAESFPGFKAEKQQITTRVFQDWWIIYQQGYPVLDLLLRPSTPILPPSTAHFKISNFKLYQYHGRDLNINYFNIFNISNARATRIDVCVDFHTLTNGLHPQKFIQGVTKGLYLRKYSGRFKVEGTQAKRPVYHYLRYGSATSPVSFYLYNKSKELKEKTLKPWIIDMWKARGLDINQDVWRIEFSIKDTRLRFYDTSTGEGFGIHEVSFLKKSQLDLLISACMNRYASFVINDGQKNISRMKPIQLLPENFHSYNAYIAPAAHASNNLQKFTIKQLTLLEQDLRLNKQLKTEHIIQAITDYEKRFNLEGYHTRYSIH